MNSKSGIKGRIIYNLYGPDGQLKQSGTTENVVTVQGNNYYVDQLSDSGGVAVKLMVLGTAAAVTPGTTDTWVSGVFSNNGSAVGTAGGVAAATNSGTAASLQYVGTFAAGYATQTGDPLTEVGLTNLDPAADGNGTTDNSTTFFAAYGTLNPSVTKGASDTLVCTWDHLFIGS